MAIEPVTPQEWQEAVDAAHDCLSFEAARMYGFVTGGPAVDVNLCKEILKQGRALGYEPRSDALGRMLAALHGA